VTARSPSSQAIVAALTFPAALCIWWVAAPGYSALLRQATRVALGPFQLILAGVAGGGTIAVDVAPALSGLPLAATHVNVVAVAVLVASVPAASGSRRLVMIGLASVMLALTHVLGVLFLVDWSYLRALSSASVVATPAARAVVSSVGYWAFCRIAPLAAPVLIWLAVVRASASQVAPRR